MLSLTSSRTRHTHGTHVYMQAKHSYTNIINLQTVQSFMYMAVSFKRIIHRQTSQEKPLCGIFSLSALTGM